MMRATLKLQFVRRQEGKEVIRVLQQQWLDDDPPDEGPMRYEWRDVPCVDAQTRALGTQLS
jgi:hypothetical protein